MNGYPYPQQAQQQPQPQQSPPAVLGDDVVPARPAGELGPPRRLRPGIVGEELQLERGEGGHVGPPGLPQRRAGGVHGGAHRAAPRSAVVNASGRRR